jgi:hypothetical protein
MVMRIAQALPEQVTAFIEGRISLSELQLWLAEYDQAIADANDPGAAELSDHAWIFIGEWLDGLRDEPSVRVEMSQVLAHQPPLARPG